MKSYRRRPSRAGANRGSHHHGRKRSSRWAGDDGDGGDGRPLLLWSGETQMPVPGRPHRRGSPGQRLSRLRKGCTRAVMILCAGVCIRSPDQTVDEHRHNHHNHHADRARCDDCDGCDGHRLLFRSANAQMPRQNGSFRVRKPCSGGERSVSLPTGCKPRFAGVCSWRSRAQKTRQSAGLMNGEGRRNET